MGRGWNFAPGSQPDRRCVSSAAQTNHHRLGLKHKKTFPHGSGGWGSRIKASAGLVSRGRQAPPPSRTLRGSVSGHTPRPPLGPPLIGAASYQAWARPSAAP